MAGYLDQYGAGDDRRETLVKRIVILALLIVIGGGLISYIFKNHGQERLVKGFLPRLRARDYSGAYQLWGCSEAKPCAGYAYDKFLEDWGSKSSAADVSLLHIEDSESCGTGVILTVNVNRTRQEKLWIERDKSVIGFSPVPVCPHKGSLAIMLHRTVGQLRKPFLN